MDEYSEFYKFEPPDRILTERQAEDRAGRPRGTFKQWRHRGLPLPGSIQIGRRYYYRASEIDRFLEERTKYVCAVCRSVSVEGGEGFALPTNNSFGAGQRGIPEQTHGDEVAGGE